MLSVLPDIQVVRYVSSWHTRENEKLENVMRVSELIEQLSQMNPDAYVTTGVSVDKVHEFEASPETEPEVSEDKHGVVTLWGTIREEDFEFVEKLDFDSAIDGKNEEIDLLEDDVERLEEMVRELRKVRAS